ncbi:hypothetical protein AVEN_117202-1 [Araneus ventricosus]|uniref:Uncharacterized protein n=1 Tax=Araneus ventricosus TaxID=182803 RepID=A0A4Y2AWK9_ARAVE|nr:hypothetical protein AVEN_117202-1 [Araneus ventricosus]
MARRRLSLPLFSKFSHRTSRRTFVHYVRFSVQQALNTADLQWNRVSNLEPFVSEAETLPLGHLTLAPLINDCTVAVAPEENEVSPSTSQINVSIQSIVLLPRHEQRGAKRKNESQKSEIMTN